MDRRSGIKAALKSQKSALLGSHSHAALKQDDPNYETVWRMLRNHAAANSSPSLAHFKQIADEVLSKIPAACDQRADFNEKALKQ